MIVRQILITVDDQIWDKLSQEEKEGFSNWIDRYDPVQGVLDYLPNRDSDFYLECSEDARQAYETCQIEYLHISNHIKPHQTTGDQNEPSRDSADSKTQEEDQAST